MTKHIHIYTGARGSSPKYNALHTKPVRDAGFDESKHKRDHGKFAAASGGSADHHAALASKHYVLGLDGDKSHQDISTHHFRASFLLGVQGMMLPGKKRDQTLSLAREHAAKAEELKANLPKSHPPLSPKDLEDNPKPRSPLSKWGLQPGGSYNEVDKGPVGGIPGIGRSSSNRAPGEIKAANENASRIKKLQDSIAKMKKLRVPPVHQPTHEKDIKQWEAQLKRLQEAK